MIALITAIIVLSLSLVGTIHLLRYVTRQKAVLPPAKFVLASGAALVLLATAGILSRINLVNAQTSDLSVEILAGYNLVVDSNVQSPSTFGPSAATVAARVCNNSGSSIANATVYIGNYTGSGSTGGTPGIYPSRDSTNTSFQNEHPALANSGSYAFTHEGGRLGTTGATRQLGTLAAGQCVVQYWTLSYPRCENSEEPPCSGDAVWGNSVKPDDDLYLDFDVWAAGTGTSGTVADDQTWRMYLRNEISAMANKIEPNGNPGGTWFNTNPGTVQVGGVITTNGFLYRIGNVRFGFDNDNDFVPDYNFWLQPIGDASQFDSGCFRLIRTSGVITVEGGTPKTIPFVDQLYFTRPEIPTDNTNITGEVFYTFLAMGTQCLAAPTPYQEAASGYDNEKFNGDFGAGGSVPIDSSSVVIGINKAGNPDTVVLGDLITYTIPFINNGTKSAGLLLYNGSFVNTPLVISDTIPDGAIYQTGSATYTLTAPKNGVKILFSSNDGQTWSETEPVTVTNIQWWLQDPLDPNDDGSAEFSILIPATYTGTPVVENCADAQFGNGTSVNQACDTTLVQGNNVIGNEVWQDDDADGLRDSGEPYLDNILVSLFWDKNGDGAVDGNDVLMLTTTTGITTTGFYTFNNLLNGDYIVKVDGNDPDIPFGYSDTTGDLFAMTLSNNDFLDADFGFGPALSVNKTLLSPSTYEGREVTYKIEVSNLRPGDGTGGASACTFETWARQSDSTHQTGAVWNNEAGAFGTNEPDDQYADTSISSQADSIAGTNFNLGSVAGNITKIEAIFWMYLDQPIAIDDTVGAELYYNDNLSGTITFSVTDVNSLQPGISKKGFLNWDITSLNNWQISDFNGTILDLVLLTNKGTGIGGTKISLDTMGFRITTDAQCGGPDDTLNPVPLKDTFNADLLQFVSAEPPNTSWSTGGTGPYANTGLIQWNNIGPLYAGQVKEITVTFRGLEPSPSPQTLTNTATVSNAYFITGEQANNDTDDAVTTITETGSISGVVWSDGNNNGWQGTTGYDNLGTNDFGIPGVTVTLYACYDDDVASSGVLVTSNTVAGNKTCAAQNGNSGEWRAIFTKTTGAGGSYLFDGLFDGYYYVAVDTISLPGGSGTQTAEADFAANGAGHNSPLDNIWGESNVNTTNLQTNAGVNILNPIDVASDITDVSFGYVVNAALYGYIWQDYDADGDIDGNEPALDSGTNGITVTLTDDLGNITTTQTTAAGYYEFTGLNSTRSYTITVDPSTLPGGAAAWTNTFDPDGGIISPDNEYPVGTLGAGEISGAHNFGYRGNAAIGDTVYTDWNGDGSQGTGELGIQNVDVYLYRDENSDGQLNNGDTLVLTDTTDPSGNYLFSNIPADDWIVQVDSSGLVGYQQTGDRDGTFDDQAAFTTTGTADVLDADFGYQPGDGASIGDLVWKDMDGNGIRSGSRETGIQNISVTLYADIDGDGVLSSSVDAVISTTVTDSSGSYLFENLISGTYLVDVATDDPDLPQGSFGNPYLLTTNNDPLSVTLTTGQSYLLADFGFAPPARVGDFIYQDNNKNGQFDLGEPGIDGVTVTLYIDVNQDRQLDAGDTVYSTTTTVNGVYNFTGLPAGSYVISVTDSVLTALGYTRTGDPDNVGGVCELTDSDGLSFNDCDAESGFTLRLGQIDVTRDFGYLPPRSIGDLIWLDSNGNGIQESGERGLGGITVTVTLPGGGTSTTTTDNQGYYSFGSNVLGNSNGGFTVTIDPGSTYTHTYDFDGGTASPDGQTVVAINSTGFFTDVLDFGLRQNGTRTLTGTVFFDNGGSTDTITDIFTIGDSPYQGITVTLYFSGGTRIGDTTTDAGGRYTFTNLFDNTDYVVVVEKNNTLQQQTLTARPDGTVSATFSSPTDTTATSRVTVSTGTTGAGNVDFGYFTSQPILNITKSANPSGNVAAGDFLTYTIVVSNSGSLSATNTVISDTLPAEVNLVSVSVEPASNGITSTTTPPTLLSGAIITNGERITLTVVVTVDNAVGSGAVITNVAAVSSTETATFTNSSPVANPVQLPTQADLGISKFDVPKVVRPGDTLTYTIRFENNGPGAVDAITITEQLPSELNSFTYIDALLIVSPTLQLAGSAAISNPVTAGSSITWTGSYPPGQIISGSVGYLTFTVNVDTSFPTTNPEITNTAAITANTTDPVPGNNTVTETTPIADIIVEKATNGSDADTLPGPSISFGDPVTWTYRVTNTGSITLTSVQVRDVDSNGSLVVITPTASITLAPGAAVTLTYASTASATSQYTNTATVTGTATSTGTDAFGNPVNSTTTVTGSDLSHYAPVLIDLSLTKQVSNATPDVGSTIVFTITVSNAGPSDATGVVISDVLPSGFDFVGYIASTGTYSNSTGLWQTMTISNGEVITLTITATVEASGVYTNLAEVESANETDPNSTPGNGVDTDGDGNVDNDSGDEDDGDGAGVTPRAVDLSIVKSSTPNPYVADELITYTLTVTNFGPTTVDVITITDDMGSVPLTGPITYTASRGTFTDTTGLWTGVNLSAGDAVSLTIVSRVLTGTAGVISNTAVVTTSEAPDLNPSNNDDTDQNPTQFADLALAKVVNDPTPTFGDTITFSIVLTNNGPNPATGVQVEDILPNGLLFASYNTSDGSTYSSTNGIWDVGGLSLNETITLTIVATVNTTSQISNTAEVVGLIEEDPTSTPNNDDPAEDDQDSVPITPQVTPGLTLDPDHTASLLPGQFITYTHVLTNDGNALDVFTLTLASAGPFTVTSNLPPTVPLAPGLTATFVITVQVPTTAAPTDQEVTVITATSSLDPNLSDTATDTTTVGSVPGVVIGPDNSSTTLPGTIVTYTHIVTNTGNATDTFTITAGSNQGYTVTTSIPSVTLAPNVTATVVVSITIPGGISSTVTDTTTITATSGISPTVSDTATDTTTVATQFVDGVVYLDVDGDGVFSSTVDTPLPNVDVVITDTNGITYVVTTNGSGVFSQTVPLGDTIVDVDETDPDFPANTSLTTGSTDPTTVGVPAGGSATDNTGYVTPPIIGLAKRVDGNTDNGDNTHTVTYTLVVENLGSTILNNVQITDDLSSTFAGASGFAVTVAPSSDLLTPNAGFTGVAPNSTLLAGTDSLSPNQSASVSFTVVVTPGANLGPYTNTATAGGSHPIGGSVSDDSDNGSNPDPDDNNTPDENTPTPVSFAPGADLELTKSVAPATVQVGKRLTYTIVVVNQGPLTATNVSVEDSLPAGLSLAASSATEGSYSAPIWTIGDIDPGQSVTLTLVVTANTSSLITNTALISTATENDPDSTPGNNEPTEDDQDSAAITPQVTPGVVIGPDNSSTTLPGTTVTYTHIVTNTGNATDTFTLTAGSNQGYVVQTSIPTVTLAPNATATVVVSITIPGGISSTVTDTTTITATSGISPTLSDTATDTTTVGSVPGVVIGPDNSSTTLPGRTVTYTHIVTNTGNATDTFSLTAGSNQGYVVQTSIPTVTLAPNATATVVVSITIPTGVFSGTVDTTTITATSGISPTLSDTATDTTTVGSVPGVVIGPNNSSTTLPGTTVTYTHIVTNTGNATDTFTLTAGSNQGYTVTTSIPSVTLAPNVTATVVVSITIPGGISSTVTDTTTITATSGISPTLSDTATDTTTVNPAVNNPGVAIVKSVDVSSVAPNQIVTYTLTVSNSGDVTLNPVAVTDTLPSIFTFGGATPTPDSTTNNILVWNDVTGGAGLAPNAQVQLVITAGTPLTIGTYVNVSVVEATHPSGVVTDTDSVPLFVTDPVVNLVKNVVPPGAVDGVITFTILITNTGPSTLDVVPLIDLYSGPIEYIGGTPPANSNINNRLTWNDLTTTTINGFAQNLDPGQTFTVTTVFSLITQSIEFSMTNVATVTNAVDVFNNPVTDVSDPEDLINQPTAISLLYFEADRQGDLVLINWETAVEIDNFGFRILRSATGLLADATEITFIPSHGSGTMSGASYSYIDQTAAPNVRYTYWLVDVDVNGVETQHGPVVVEALSTDANEETTIYMPVIVKE